MKLFLNLNPTLTSNSQLNHILIEFCYVYKSSYFFIYLFLCFQSFQVSSPCLIHSTSVPLVAPSVSFCTLSTVSLPTGCISTNKPSEPTLHLVLPLHRFVADSHVNLVVSVFYSFFLFCGLFSSLFGHFNAKWQKRFNFYWFRLEEVKGRWLKEYEKMNWITGYRRLREGWGIFNFENWMGGRWVWGRGLV